LLLIDSKGVPHKSGPDSCNGSRPDLCGTPLLSISNKVCDSVLRCATPYCDGRYCSKSPASSCIVTLLTVTSKLSPR